MKLSITQTLAAPPERVFAALHDPEVLRKCIEGCEKLVRVSDGVYESTLRVGLAGIKGTYAGKVELRDPKPPESFTLVLEGKGPGSFVRGASKVTLRAKDGGTELAAEGEGTVGGVIAAVGSRLVEAAAKKMAADFFRKLADVINQRV
jgi:hypothetical protein